MIGRRVIGPRAIGGRASASVVAGVLAGVLGLGGFGGVGGVALGRDEADFSLGRRVPEARFEPATLADAIDFLRDVGGLNIRVDWGVLERAGVDRTTPINLRLRNLTARRVLEAVLREAGAGAKLTYEIDDGVIEITTQEEADRRLVVEVYEVRDLLFTPLDAGRAPEVQFQLDAVTRGGGGGSGGNLFGGSSSGGQTEDKTPDQRGEELAQLIMQLIRPEVWNVNGGPASIRYFNGTLIVSAPRSVQELIGVPVRADR